MTTLVTGKAQAAIRKATVRLMPVVALGYFFAFLDRTNLAVASLKMNSDIGINAAQYGLGAGLFFAGYIVLQTPSNLGLHRFGARIWVPGIMCLWGVVAALSSIIHGEVSFYVLRSLLGVTEAGFFPGIILYLSYWFPGALRGRMSGMFMVAIPMCTAIGAPVSGAMLDAWGWRWMFVLEGIPSVILGIAAFWLLPNRPKDARWLAPGESSALTELLAEEERQVQRRSPLKLGQSLRHPRTIGLGLVYFAIDMGLFGLAFWMPQIVKSSLQITDNFTVTLLTAIRYLIAVPAMIVAGRLTQRVGRPIHFTAIPLAVGGVALGVSALLVGAPWLGYLGLCICAIGVMCSFPGFWSLPSAFLAGVAAAGSIAMINSIATVSGFFAPYWVGLMTTQFGSSKWGLVTIAGVMVAGAVLVVAMRQPSRVSSGSEAGNDAAAEAAMSTPRPGATNNEPS